MRESPFPDPNRALSDYHSDVATYGTLKANWWRVMASVALPMRRLQCKLIRALCRSLAESRATPPLMRVSLADLAHWLDGGGLTTVDGFVKACRMRERVRRGDD